MMDIDILLPLSNISYFITENYDLQQDNRDSQQCDSDHRHCHPNIVQEDLELYVS